MSDSDKKPDPEEGPSSKRQKTDDKKYEVKISEQYSDSSFVNTLSKMFINKKDHNFVNDALITHEPFTCCVLPNFLNPIQNVNLLKEDIEEIDVSELNSDLYQFKQSNDFKGFDTAPITSLKNFFHGSLLKWMKDVTKIPLEDKIDISCSCYTYTDHLLCHDDELEGRRIAYIYYLVPEWTDSDGGTFDLFNSVDSQPTDICKSFVPEFNKLLFFEVGEVSFHQVSEILSFKTRTSISGWFYGPPIKRSTKLREIICFKSPVSNSVDLKDWINSTYLNPDTQMEIRESFEGSSEIELMSFLLASKYEELGKALRNSEIYWMTKGPANRRNFDQAFKDSLPTIGEHLHNMFRSENFLLLLSNLTGLKLHPLVATAEEEDKIEMGKTSVVFRKWSHGSYSLLHNQSFMEKPTLLVSLSFNCDEWDAECGGFTSYVVKEEKEELLRVDPKPNSMALVYITPETAHFVKYINCKIKDNALQSFHDVWAMYQEGQ